MVGEIVCSPRIKKYFDRLDKETRTTHALATKAREVGFDPEHKVDILLAASVGKRVEGIIAVVEPRIVDSGVAERIFTLEKKYGPGDWRVGMVIAWEVANHQFFKMDKEEHALATGIRTGLAYTTNGVVSAPVEGLAAIKLRPRQDGKGEYISVYFAGPIRGAGATQQGVALIIADYVRVKKGLAKYDPTPDEVNRYYTEMIDYYERVERKQYKPTKEEMNWIIPNMPIEINGDPTAELEVSNYKNLPRVETNRIRGGLALVLTDGVVKYPKLWKQVSKWQDEFGIDWNWMKEYFKIKKKVRALDSAGEKTDESKNKNKLTPNFYYVSEIVAGRPVFGYPLETGGFRLRYGRSRLTGDGSWAVSPLSGRLLLDFLATGTQLRVERPGKSTALTMCDSIEGPIVKLENGNVVRLETEEQVKKLRSQVKEILFVGDILISHGDFNEQGTTLVPPGYCEEWWLLEIEKQEKDKGVDLRQVVGDLADRLKKDIFKTVPSFEDSLKISMKLNVPFHPYWTLHWKDISEEDYNNLVGWWLAKEHSLESESDKKVKRSLEILGCPHVVEKGKVVFAEEYAKVLNFFLKETSTGEDGLACVNKTSNVTQRDKSGTAIGVRMGRPEKCKVRPMKGTPHLLFPVGDEGGRLRTFQAAAQNGKVTAQFPIFYCDKCNLQTIYSRCETCRSLTKLYRICPICKKKTIDLKCHRPTQTYEKIALDVTKYINSARKVTNIPQIPTQIKGVRGMMNKDHFVEYFGKGLLRAKYNLPVNKDGTIRFDMSELGITHFKPKEIGLSIEKAKELGYDVDIKGAPLTHEEQILEIFPQDVVMPACPESPNELSDVVFMRIANFVDEELVKIYNQKPFYNVTKRADLIGQLVIGLAPHTSAGIIGRIIGFSETQGGFAHPYWHDAQRRDLDGEETAAFLLMDGFLNFSRQYLPDRRGGRSMDAPLVLSTKLNVEEIDDEVFDVDTGWRYPLYFYEAAMEMKAPWDIKIDQIKHRVGKPEQYEGIGYTHPVSNMNIGIRNSAYKSLPTMLEKMGGQLKLAQQIRAVDLGKVAQLIVEGHFVRDIKGNLRKFTKQTYRCTSCNTIYRRLPLNGTCDQCKKGNLVFTIAEGTIKKYLEPTLKLIEYEGVSPFIKQSIELLSQRVESVFGRDKTKQLGLDSFN
ncbi:DNA polymerase II large subunit [Candidatus Woesearchaeota archaeon]|nr:DNA polymerase II large subunit [Candidatus Woesearchaeota archaeon]